MNQLFVSSVAMLMLFVWSNTAHSGIMMSAQQVGNDVIISGSGTVNLADLTFDRNFATFSLVHSTAAAVKIGADNDLDVYGSVMGPTSFGTLDSIIAADSQSGDGMYIFGGGAFLLVPEGYVSGDPLSGSSTWNDATLASLGLTEGVYEWTWGSGDNADSWTFTIGDGNVVPEPTSAIVWGMLAGIGMLTVRRRT